MLTTKRNDVLPLAGLLIAALILLAGPAGAQGEASQVSRERAAIAVGPGTEADAVRALLERLPEHELKGVYRRCNAEALASRLASTEIALCSVAYDVLLKQHFHGEFETLLAWSSGSRHLAD